MTSYLTSFVNYVYDSRTLPFSGIPDATSSSDPYLNELLELYPSDIYPGGRYFDLPYGRTRVWKFGTDKKGKVLLVHGLSIPSFIWEPVAKFLEAQGYEVALFDLYGRGYTDAPRVSYQSQLYVNQILGVLDKLGWSEPIYLAGLSMGGPITTHFAATFPERVKKLALLAPVGFLKWPSPLSRFGRFMLTVPFARLSASWPVRKALARYNTPSRIAKPPSQSTERLGRVAALQWCTLQGYAPAILSSLNEGPIFDFRQPYFALQRSEVDTLVIWGTADADAPYSTSEPMMRVLSGRAKLHTIKDGAHDLPVSNTLETCRALLDFFK